MKEIKIKDHTFEMTIAELTKLRSDIDGVIQRHQNRAIDELMQDRIKRLTEEGTKRINTWNKQRGAEIYWFISSFSVNDGNIVYSGFIVDLRENKLRVQSFEKSSLAIGDVDRTYCSLVLFKDEKKIQTLQKHLNYYLENVKNKVI